MDHLLKLWPELIMAWAGWTIHGLVHSAGHILTKQVKNLLRRTK